MSDNDLAVVRTVETLSGVGFDTSNVITGEGNQVFRRDSVPMNVDNALAKFGIF